MDFRTLFAVGGGLAALALVAGWRGARPPNLQRGPRLVPWRFIMLLSAAVAILLIFQALRLSGWLPHR
ncbi:MAG: hypothetical protein GC203_15015 [Phenylobacterium sp.]|uniref:hypothetical protein n=1 Tax=Phenylobacterium sp. TaxID=1871053 RepID=UPI0025F8EB11|nr:hypothetical protein [Phenylobacterium sp.]MBI1199169.1 hypothetical protein [Phenylobacterium sp.]